MYFANNIGISNRIHNFFATMSSDELKKAIKEILLR